MAKDERRDEGQFYPYGKRVLPPSQADGDVKHSEFADLSVETNTVPGLRAAVQALAQRLGATVVGCLAVCAAAGAGFDSVPVNEIDFDENPSVVTSVSFEGLATTEDVAEAAQSSTNYTDAAISGLSIRPLATNTYNLASNAGYYIAVRDLAVAFGATVTNDPYAVPPAPAPEPTPPTPEARRIALFLVDVNDAADGVYCGFELKASTNNFTHATNEDVRLQFYAQSEIADTGEGATPGNSLGIDRMMLFTGTSAGTEDVRAWTRIPNTVEWSGKPMRMAVLVDASCLVRHPEDGGDWLSEGNEELVWCYLRNRALSPPYEREGSTAHSLWRPIQPARWYSSLPEWAR